MPTRSPLRAAALAAAIFTSACATLPPPAPLAGEKALTLDGATFLLQFDPVDAPTVRDVEEALANSLPRLERWGGFEAPIRLRIHPTHEALEAAVSRFDYPWLRAWAKYDSIDLQSPRTWGALGGGKAALVELLTHELTHCLMYQRSATAEDWPRKGIPLWFREGMASVTAEQGYRRPTEEDLWRYLDANPGKDPVGEGNRLYQAEADVVYGAAHRAFAFLVERYGDESVLQLMDAMRRGLRFPAAFEEVVGMEAEAFTREFGRYVRWEGWRGPGSAGPFRVPRERPQLRRVDSSGGNGS